MSDARRYDYVDLLRGFAALSVLICHYQWFFAPEIGQGWPTNIAMPFEAILAPFYGYGGIAVELFWVLSGFVFAVAYGAKGRDLSARQFTVHRVARLYPLHLVTLGFIAVIQGIGLAINGKWQVYGANDLPHFLAHLAFASNWFTEEFSFNGPIWSVSVEVLVYLAFLAYMKVAGLRLSVALFLTALSYLFGKLTHSQVGTCAALFFIGVSIAIIAPILHQRIGWRLLPLAVAGLVSVVAIGFLATWFGLGAKVPTFAIFAGMPAILCVFVALDLTAKPLPERWHWIGASTYAIYLLHMPIVILVRTIIGGPLAGPSEWSFLLFLITVIGLSVPCYRYFEMPAQRWVRRQLSPDNAMTRRSVKVID